MNIFDPLTSWFGTRFSVLILQASKPLYLVPTALTV